MSETMPASAVVQPVAPKDRAALERKALDSLRAMQARVNREDPDPAALEDLRAHMKAFPFLSQLLCDLHDWNTQKVIASIGADRASVEALTVNVRCLRDDLGYKDASALERPLIEHVALCWLRLQKAELSYSQLLAGEPTLARATYGERRLTMAQTRYLRAGESLARVRRLAQPHRRPLQLNIGGQQVNIAGGTSGATDAEAGPASQAASTGR